jgi:type IV pilus assembly protein PilW
MNRIAKNRGFSLVELMVAMVISLFLLAGVLSIMINSKKTYNTQSDVNRLQENARYALEFMARDIRMNGYFGCSGNIPEPPADYTLQATNGANGASDSLRISSVDTVADHWIVRQTVANATPLTNGRTTFTNINLAGHLATGDSVIVSDCLGLEVHTRVTVNGTTLTLNEGLSRDFDNGTQTAAAEMRRLVSYTYRISGLDEAGNEDGSANPFVRALFRGNEVVVEGVENMQLRYGIDTDTPEDLIPNRYVTANNINNLPVNSLRITLLMTTIEQRPDVDLNTDTFVLDPDDHGTTAFDPVDDHRRRRVFSMTVQPRNG